MRKTYMMILILIVAVAVAMPAHAEDGQGMQTHQEPQQKPEAGDAEPQAPSAPEESKQAQEPSVFQQLARDPFIRRYGHPPGDGWIPMPGTRTELRFGGFVQLNVIHDFQDTGFPFGDFIPAQIPVPTDDTPNTEFDARTSRVTFETRTDTKETGSVSTMISMDFAGQDTEDSIQPRLRQAYVTWVGPLSSISFTAGQAWTSFLDLGVWPELFDLEGPNAMTGTRQGLLRGAYAFGQEKQLVFGLALEQPETQVANGNGLRDWPDLVARINWQRNWGHLQGAAVGRQLVAESTAGTGKDSAFGLGLSLSGSWLIPGTKRKNAPSDDLGPRQDKIQFQIQGGPGIGRYVFDLGSAPTPQDAVYDDVTAEITPLDELGAFAAYHHWWTNKLRSTFVYGVVSVDTLAIQLPTALDRTTYAVANLVYRPFRRMDVGAEYYWGERENKDGQTGDASRLMFAVNFGF